MFRRITRVRQGKLCICALVVALALFTLPASAEDATSLPEWAMGPFVKMKEPVLSPTPESEFECPILGDVVKFEALNAYNPAAAVKDGKVYLFYRGDTQSWKWPPVEGRPWNEGPTCRIAMAYSEDGRNFTRHRDPVLYPDKDFMEEYEWPAGLWDPRLIEDEDGTYYMYYNTWNGATHRLCVATSTDLIHWEKKGSIFQRAPERYRGDCISGSVVWRPVAHRKVATRINGKYWMYYHHHNFIATSDNLIDWTPFEEDGHPKPVMTYPRPGHYDKSSGEPGTAMLTDRGILLIVNGLNGDPPGDPSLPANAWSIGQTLLDRNDPTKLLKRADKPTICAVEKWEREGFSSNCAVMHDGMVFFKGQWLLYYGGADKHIGLAVYTPSGE